MSNDYSSLLGEWNSHVAELIGAEKSEAFSEKLVAACNSLVASDVSYIEAFPAARRPASLYADVPDDVRKISVDAYFAGAYLLDPYYRAGLNGIAPGMYGLRDVAPRGFRESEYYRHFYRASRQIDEVVFIADDSKGGFMHLSLGRLEGSKRFSAREIELLHSVRPVVVRFLGQLGESRHETASAAPKVLRSHLQDALERFGDSILTKREAQIMRLYLQGHSTRSICDHLHITAHTVTTHRRSTYLKLDINSQGQLFHLFIDSISCFDPDAPSDPLQGYLSVRSA